MVELGLQRIDRLLKHTPIPWKAIHVAGTNGKGSICAYISALLYAGGVRCGRFISPHLIDRWDCITIDEKPIKESVFRKIEKAVMARNTAEGIGATEFELLTATAFEIFTKKKISVGVVEVGMGGRLDATNVLKSPAVTVISKIGLDHQAFLGNTIEAIAREKAGILKPGVPCVVDGSNDPAVLEVVEAVAQEVGAGKVYRHQNLPPIWPSEPNFKRFHKLPPHQRRNIAIAFKALELLYAGEDPWLPSKFLLTKYNTERSRQTKAQGIPSETSRYSQVNGDAVLNAIWKAKLRGRLEEVKITALTGRRRPILLDGAHNEQSAEVLGQHITWKNWPFGRNFWQGKQVFYYPATWVLAASKGKDIEGMLRHLIREGDRVVAVEFGPVDGMPWVQPMPAKEILDSVAKLGLAKEMIDCGKDVRAGLQKASDLAREEPLVIAGSLYLVSDVLRLLRNAKPRARLKQRLEKGSSDDSNDETDEDGEEDDNDGKGRIEVTKDNESKG